jgi:hypothetical protein
VAGGPDACPEEGTAVLPTGEAPGSEAGVCFWLLLASACPPESVLACVFVAATVKPCEGEAGRSVDVASVKVALVAVI